MKKVINITIGGIVFAIEDDAYEKLSNYIASIRKHFGENEEGKEILEDIESGIAEKFEGVVKAPQPIALTHVEAVIEQMGTVHDFEDFESDEPKESGEKTKAKVKRLYRNPDDKVIAGVASGLAEFFGIDPVVTRIIFVILAFLNGFGILAYIILWLIMPKATTTAQKLEMQGEVVTLQNISDFVEEKIESVKKKDSTKPNEPVKVYGATIDFSKSALSAFGSFLRIILGIVFTLVGVGGIIALTIGSFAALVALPTIPEADPVANVIVETLFADGGNPEIILAAYFVVFIPLFSLLLGGISMLRKKSIVPAPFNIVITLLWFFALMSLLIFGSKNVPILQERIEAIEAAQVEEIPDLEADLAEFDAIISEFETIE